MKRNVDIMSNEGVNIWNTEGQLLYSRSPEIIAAAPDILETLVQIADSLQVSDSLEAAMNIKSVRRNLKYARSAIAKAMGEGA